MGRTQRRMERQKDKKRKLIIIGGLLVATLVLASAFLVASGAVFTASSANPDNLWSAGVLTQSNNKDGAAIMNLSLLKPTDVRTGTVTIGNVGNIDGTFSLTAHETAHVNGKGGADLFNVLDLTVTYTDGTGAHTAYDGHLRDFTGSAAAGAIAAGDSNTYTFTVTFPNGGTPASDTTEDNAYQGGSTTIEFDWTAVQS